MIKKAAVVLFMLLLFSLQSVDAQCEIQNTAFGSGESIKYDLYFNFGIFRARAGSGSLTVTDANYRGIKSLKTVMMLNTTGVAGNIYTVRDTLTSYIDGNLRPLLFTKEAFEGSDYSIERQSYNYKDNGEISIRTMRIFNGEERFDEELTLKECSYDYLSVLSLIRNLDFSGMNPGDNKYIKFISGKRPVNMYVNYEGISKLKANDGNTYEVIDITMTILDDAFENQKEALKASLTNDKNRIPVIIDTSLKIGSVRAVLNNVSGVRN